jgi:peptide chain release factor 1
MKTDEIKKRFKELEENLSNPEIVSDPKKLAETSKEHSSLKSLYNLISRNEEIDKSIIENKEMIENENSSELKEMAKEEIALLEKEKIETEKKLHEELNPANPNDKKNAIVEIRAGAGGDEGALFTAELFRMYSRFAEKMSWKIKILSSSENEIGGYKEMIFTVVGDKAYGNLKYEAGTHRVQRVPETEKQGRVHTSTSTVIVLPEAEEVDLEIDPNDLKIDTFCSSGPGGQSVNTTHSAIRITHIPSGTVASCQDQKSQHQNKEKALQIIRSKLLSKIEEEKMAEDSEERKGQVGKGDRSDKVRTYNFPQGRVTDHRVGKSWHGIDKIMEGEIEPIIGELKKMQ